MSTVSADSSMTVPAPAFAALSTSQECAALAQAMRIKAWVKLAQAYASLYQEWIAEDQALRETTLGMGPVLAAVLGRAGRPVPW
jgi:hypothetical protein